MNTLRNRISSLERKLAASFRPAIAFLHRAGTIAAAGRTFPDRATFDADEEVRPRTISIIPWSTFGIPSSPEEADEWKRNGRPSIEFL